jgi:hypothetical protein
MRPALELGDLLDQVRELMRVELSLFPVEIGERASGIPTSPIIGLGFALWTMSRSEIATR